MKRIILTALSILLLAQPAFAYTWLFYRVTVRVEASRSSAFLASITPVPTDTPTPTDTPVPTDTPAPTDTPTPTDTPIPTDTPATTDTPIPTDIPAPSTPLAEKITAEPSGEIVVEEQAVEPGEENTPEEITMEEQAEESATSTEEIIEIIPTQGSEEEPELTVIEERLGVESTPGEAQQ